MLEKLTISWNTNEPQQLFYKDWFGIKQPTKVDMTLNIEKKRRDGR